MNKVALSNVIIELHVPDFGKVRDFYGKLGFQEVWERAPKNRDGYLVMKRGDSILAFYCGNEEVYNHSYFRKFPKNTPRGYGTEIAIYLIGEKIEDYYKDISSKINKDLIVQPLETKPWGTKDFRITDPFGYYLCVREEGDILEK